MYTQNGKSNITSFLIGTCDNGENKLQIYKYPSDRKLVGPIQLDIQIL